MSDEWKLLAHCAPSTGIDPEVWFPDENYVRMDLGVKPLPAVLRPKNICFRCPVRKECWDDAVLPISSYEVRMRSGSSHVFEKPSMDFVGVRAGQTGKERRWLIRNHGEEAFKRSEERLGIQINLWGIDKEGAA